MILPNPNSLTHTYVTVQNYKTWNDDHMLSLATYHFTGCSPRNLWNPSANFLPDVSLLEDAAQYPSCNARSVGSIVLVNTTLDTATVAYYSGNTPGSRACFVCDESSGYELNTSTIERVCQSDGMWSGSPIVCGKS